MKLVRADVISEIDNYAENALGISKAELMRRSGEAISCAVRSLIGEGKGVKVIFLCGGGNNGGDGYAAASLLGASVYSVMLDVFSVGQRTAEGKNFLEKCVEMGIRVENYDDILAEKLIREADVLVDCIFGTGVRLPYPERAVRIAELISSSSAKKIAVDVPLGVNPTTGEVMDIAPHYDITVELSFGKCGIYSYPAKEYVGRIILDEIGIPRDTLDFVGGSEYELIDNRVAAEILPRRYDNSSKGSYGKAFICAGSKKYKGAACLALESALRSGVGYVTLYSVSDVTDVLLGKFPEAIYVSGEPFYDFSDANIKDILERITASDACLIGPGCDRSEGLFRLVEAVLGEPGAAVILDADAINVIAERGRADIITNAKRSVILTPHPGELARLISLPVSQIQANRLEICRQVSRELCCTVILKGAATVICGEGRSYINSTGSSALAKAGSGDALAGLLCGIIAQGAKGYTEAAALAAYIHGLAGDVLSDELSCYGVTPSDLPKEMARQIRKIM